jgi:hypothetical protein
MVIQRSGPRGNPREKWLRDLTPDNATAPAPDPTPDKSGHAGTVRCLSSGVPRHHARLTQRWIAQPGRLAVPAVGLEGMTSFTRGN